MCVPAVCSHEIVCLKGSVAPWTHEDNRYGQNIFKKTLDIFCSLNIFQAADT